MNVHYAMHVTQHGGTDVLTKIPLSLPKLEPNEIRLKHISIGLNFIDTYHRSGLYPIPLPSILGAEAVGEVEEIGNDVDHLQLGQVVGYCSAGLGAYATHRNIDANRVFEIPASIDPKKAAGCLLKGLTCEYLIQRCAPTQSGQTVLFHAIAGGIGLIACQWLKQKGVTVIGTTSNRQKADIATQNGCDHIIRYDKEDVAEQVMRITKGQGVPIVFDGVGKTTFAASLDSLSARGTLVSFGNASGAVETFAPSLLAQKGSLFITRPTLGDYVSSRAELQQSAADLFKAIENGLSLHCDTEYALSNVAQAHTDLQNRKIIGQAVLIP